MGFGPDEHGKGQAPDFAGLIPLAYSSGFLLTTSEGRYRRAVNSGLAKNLTRWNQGNVRLTSHLASPQRDDLDVWLEKARHGLSWQQIAIKHFLSV
jgi:hypothetical protein